MPSIQIEVRGIYRRIRGCPFQKRLSPSFAKFTRLTVKIILIYIISIVKDKFQRLSLFRKIKGKVKVLFFSAV